MPDSAIRPATESDLQRLVAVEVEAGQLFHTVGMSEVAGDVPDVADLGKHLQSQQLWVTEVGSVVAGYIAAEVLDGNAHIAQVSVAPPYGRRGLGRRMIGLVESWGRAAGRPATTLTTFRDVPWNGPYYARLGYAILPAERIGPELRRTMEHEATLPGIDASRRCAMVKGS
jgi:ribosomal protein S18 acetylase RimI-like enzyme